MATDKPILVLEDMLTHVLILVTDASTIGHGGSDFQNRNWAFHPDGIGFHGSQTDVNSRITGLGTTFGSIEHAKLA